MAKGLEKKEVIVRTNLIKIDNKPVQNGQIEYYTDDSIMPIKRQVFTVE